MCNSSVRRNQASVHDLMPYECPGIVRRKTHIGRTWKNAGLRFVRVPSTWHDAATHETNALRIELSAPPQSSCWNDTNLVLAGVGSKFLFRSMCNQQETQQFLWDVARQNLQCDSMMTSLGCSPLAKRAMHLQGGLPEMHPLPSCSLTITFWQSNPRVGDGGIFAVPLLNSDATCEAVAAKGLTAKGLVAIWAVAAVWVVESLPWPFPALGCCFPFPCPFLLSFPFGCLDGVLRGAALANSVVTHRLSGLFGCVVKAWTALPCLPAPSAPPGARHAGVSGGALG